MDARTGCAPPRQARWRIGRTRTRCEAGRDRRGHQRGAAHGDRAGAAGGDRREPL